jgi:hypothetical protein
VKKYLIGQECGIYNYRILAFLNESSLYLCFSFQKYIVGNLKKTERKVLIIYRRNFDRKNDNYRLKNLLIL